MNFAKFAALILLTMLLAACSSEPSFDAADEEAVQASVDEIQKTLTAAEQVDFRRAFFYFSIGGPDGMKAGLAAAMDGTAEDPDVSLMRNLKEIDGLTGKEIIAKHQEATKKGDES